MGVRLVAGGFLLAGVGVLVGGEVPGVLTQLIGWTVVAVGLLTLRQRRAGAATVTPWYWFLGGASLFLVGGLTRFIHGELVGGTDPVPSPADAFFLAGYAVILIGELFLIRARSLDRERDNFIDALIVASAVGIVLWATEIGPFVRDPAAPTTQKLLVLSYTALTLLLLGVTTRVAVGPGARTPSYYLLAGSAVGLFAVDFLAGHQIVSGSGGGVATMLAPFMFILFGAALLHPSMGDLTQAPREPPRRLSRLRIVVLGLALLTAPAALVVQLRDGGDVDVPAAVIGWVLLGVLVMARMRGLVHANELVADREQALRSASLGLVSATNAEDMARVALDAVQTLVRPSMFIRASISTLMTDGSYQISAVSGPGSDSLVGSPLQVSGLEPGCLDAFRGFETVVMDDGPHLEPLSEPPERGSVVALIPLVSRGALLGALALNARGALRAGEIRALESLASEFSLALDSARLVEEIHRRESERRFRALVQNSSDIVTVLDDRGRVSYVSPSVETILGYEPEGLLERSVFQVFDVGMRERVAGRLASLGDQPFEQFSVEVELKDASGAEHTLDVTFTDLRHDSSVEGIVVNARDITVRKLLEQDLRHQALHDALTGLGNRSLFLHRVSERLRARDRDSAEALAVLFLDLDDFKTINDSLGHAVGDQLLVAVSERLQSVLRVRDIAARLGGDEFAVLLGDAYGESDATVVAERVLGSLRRPFDIQGREINITASMGIHLDREGSVSAEDALRNADTAMYRAKDAGKDRFELFEDTMHAGVFERLELKADLARGIESGQLLLHYQPLVELRTGRIRGVEALVRWEHPERGFMSPGTFIPLAEESGLVVPLGRWVLEEACRRTAQWSIGLASDDELAVSVNLSVRQLQEATLVEDVAAILRRSELHPSRLTLEITESVLMADTELAIDRLDALRGLGVKIALDDFGTGYSSLGYIQQLPIDYIKIDRSFVDGLGEESTDGQVVHTVVDLAHRLGLPTVAEGIEGPVQLAALRALGCELGQGFYFSKPVTDAAFEELVTRGAPVVATYEDLVRGAVSTHPASSG